MIKAHVSGGFHNVRSTLTLQLKRNSEGTLVISSGQLKKYSKHLCDDKGCQCAGMRADVELEGCDRNEFCDAMIQAEVDANYKTSY